MSFYWVQNQIRMVSSECQTFSKATQHKVFSCLLWKVGRVLSACQFSVTTSSYFSEAHLWITPENTAKVIRIVNVFSLNPFPPKGIVLFPVSINYQGFIYKTIINYTSGKLKSQHESKQAWEGTWKSHIIKQGTGDQLFIEWSCWS